MTLPAAVIAYIVAATDPFNNQPIDAIGFAQKAADEAYSATLDGTEDDSPLNDLLRRMGGHEATQTGRPSRSALEAAHAAASEAYRANLPELTNRKNTQAYIACVAYGQARRYIPAAEARGMLYSAQLALAAFPRKTRRTRCQTTKR